MRKNENNENRSRSDALVELELFSLSNMFLCIIHKKLNLSDVDNGQVRAQHGCALVELRGESGMMVVGGDSGGTRLNDVRFENVTIRYILHQSKEVRTLFVV